jgi:DMSO/TMAO reductase YedYZ molybdopterin-dependent catalytic subunit
MQGDRVPPGQTVTAKWPVLTYGDTPAVDRARWRFRVFGAVEEPREWTWAELAARPRVEVVSDVHCVTRWSRLDNRWAGVRPRDLLAEARPRAEARFVMAHAAPDYTTNLPLDALLADDVLLAVEHDGRPLPPEHGGPVRLVVPRLYFWKSAKWIWGLELLAEDRPGFWEAAGYHMRGDPWREERLGGQPRETMQAARARKARE